MISNIIKGIKANSSTLVRMRLVPVWNSKRSTMWLCATKAQILCLLFITLGPLSDSFFLYQGSPWNFEETNHLVHRRWQGHYGPNLQYTPDSVGCGNHYARACEQCPIDGYGHDHGSAWCNGDCQWRHNRCNGVDDSM